jgi:hypothetical protein
MKKSFYKGLLVLVLAAALSAFTTRRNLVNPDDKIWFDPNWAYLFQYFGTTTEALDYFGGHLAGSTALSVGFLYNRSMLPPVGNPFDTIAYNGYTGEPTYGTELKLDIYGNPALDPNEMIFE